jgi:hypothetical protein
MDEVQKRSSPERMNKPWHTRHCIINGARMLQIGLLWGHESNTIRLSVSIVWRIQHLVCLDCILSYIRGPNLVTSRRQEVACSRSEKIRESRDWEQERMSDDKPLPLIFGSTLLFSVSYRFPPSLFFFFFFLQGSICEQIYVRLSCVLKLYCTFRLSLVSLFTSWHPFRKVTDPHSVGLG